MRGKDNRIDKDDVSPGITPAYAGKSIAVAFCYAVIEDHPRVCGEKQALTRSSRKV